MKPKLLSTEEFKRFQATHIPRRVKQVDKPADPLLRLIDVVGAKLKRDGTQDDPSRVSQEIILIKTDPDDGTTWACEEVCRLIQQSFSLLQLVTFPVAQAAGSSPQILEYVGPYRLAKLLRKAGALRHTRVFARPLAMALGAAGLTFIALYLVSRNAPVTALIIGAIAAVLTLAGQILFQNISFKREEGPLREMVAGLADKNDSKVRNDLVGLLAADFLRRKPSVYLSTDTMIVLVDDFGDLDLFTQEVLKAAMKTRDTEGRYVSWILFEKANCALLHKEVLSRPALGRLACGENPVWLYRLEHLSRAEVQTLVQKLDLPAERTEHALVRDIVTGPSVEEFKRLSQKWAKFLEEEPKGQELRLSEFLRFLASNLNTPPFMLTAAECMSVFSQKAGTELKALPVILTTYGIPTLAKHEVDKLIERLRKHLAECLVDSAVSPQTPLQLRAETQDLFSSDSGSRIPDECIHLFWFMHWAKAPLRGVGQARMIQALAFHASRAYLPRKLLESAEGRKLGSNFVESIYVLAGDCLKKTFFDEARLFVKMFLQNASTILEEDSLPPPEREALLKHIVRLSWKTFAATGVVDVLTELPDCLRDLSIEEDNDPSNAGFRADCRLYFALLGASEEAAANCAARITSISSKDKQLRRRLVRILWISSADFTDLCTRFVDRTICEKAGWLLTDVAAERLKQELDPQGNRFNDIVLDDDLAILDHFIIKGAIRALTRARFLDEAKELIRSYLIAIECTSNEGKPALEGPLQVSLLDRALRLEAFAVCLDYMARIAAAQSNSIWARYSSHAGYDYSFIMNLELRESKEFCEQVFNDVAAAMQLKQRSLSAEVEWMPVEVLQNVERIYMHAAMAWEEFGLNEMRNNALLQRAQFLRDFTNISPDNSTAMSGLMKTLGSSLANNGHTGQLAHLTAATFFASWPDLASSYVAEAFSRAIDANACDEMKVLLTAAVSSALFRTTLQSYSAFKVLASKLNDDSLQRTFLRVCGSEIVQRVIQRLFDAARSTQDRELHNGVCNLYRKICVHQSQQSRAILDTYYEFYTLLWQGFDERISHREEILASWMTRQDHWLFVAVLQKLLEDRMDENILQQALSILEDEKTEYGSSPPRHLVFFLSNRAVKAKDSELGRRCMAILRDRVRPLVRVAPLESGEETYRLLMLLSESDRDSHEYGIQLARLGGLRLQRDKAERFGHLIERGQYYLVCESYFAAVESYDIPLKEMNDRFCDEWQAATSSEYRAKLAKAYDPAKIALVASDVSTRAIVRDFFMIGRSAFSDEDEAFADLRTRLNETARRDVKSFFGVISEARNIPELLRSIIVEHQAEIVTDVLASRPPST
jgi:hypothetical protein